MGTPFSAARRRKASFSELKLRLVSSRPPTTTTLSKSSGLPIALVGSNSTPQLALIGRPRSPTICQSNSTLRLRSPSSPAKRSVSMKSESGDRVKSRTRRNANFLAIRFRDYPSHTREPPIHQAIYCVLRKYNPLTRLRAHAILPTVPMWLTRRIIPKVRDEGKQRKSLRRSEASHPDDGTRSRRGSGRGGAERALRPVAHPGQGNLSPTGGRRLHRNSGEPGGEGRSDEPFDAQAVLPGRPDGLRRHWPAGGAKFQAVTDVGLEGD